MKKLLASALLATGLILNVEAQVSTVPPGISIAQPQGAPFVGQPPGAPYYVNTGAYIKSGRSAVWAAKSYG